jgi:hypothetical protein
LIKFMYFLSFRMNIQCYSSKIGFYLNLNLWFQNFFKLYFPYITSFKNKFLL